MKTAKGTWLVLAILLGVLSWPSGLRAQQNDDAAAKAEQTNNPPPGATAGEASSTATNEVSEAETVSNGMERDQMVVIGHDVELKAGETARSVVVIGGSAKIAGKVRDQVVVVGGNADITGEVGDVVVAVLGNVTAGDRAKIGHDVVAVGGKVELATGAKVLGDVHEVDWSKFGLPTPAWVRSWFVHCALMLRPLAPQVGWVWALAGIFFLFYLLIAALFPRPVAACVNELTRRPATTFLMGLLTKILLPLAILILAATGIGLFVVPFVIAALVLGAVVGKVALLEWLGFKLGHQFGGQAIKPLLALVLGTVLIWLLYMVPLLGLLTFGIISVWGLGGAVTAAFGGLRREIPEKPPMSPIPSPAPAPAMAAAAPMSSAGFTAAGSPSMTETAPSQAPRMPGLPPLIPETLSYPKAGFWERMAASFLDIVLVSIAGALVHPVAPLVALAYFAGMWTWRGTTIGGIVLGLKVVRVDGQPVTFPVALVRALAAAFSVIVLFLGYIWIAWDSEKQGWHDKIAGTVVLKLPRGTPLL